MAPDRGSPTSHGYQNVSQEPIDTNDEDEINSLRRQRSHARQYIAAHAREGQNFTVRGVLVGLGVGLIICFSNMYFGLQTGWISGMVGASSGG